MAWQSRLAIPPIKVNPTKLAPDQTSPVIYEEIHAVLNGHNHGLIIGYPGL